MILGVYWYYKCHWRPIKWQKTGAANRKVAGIFNNWNNYVLLRKIAYIISWRIEVIDMI